MAIKRHRPSGREILLHAESDAAAVDELGAMADRNLDAALSLSAAWTAREGIKMRRLRAGLLRVLGPFTARQMRLDEAITASMTAMREKQAEADDRIRALEERVAGMERSESS
jgi:hypothetical protein